MPSDLELEGSRLLNLTDGDITKAPPDVRVAAEIFLRNIDEISTKAKSAKSKKDMDFYNNQLDIMGNANPHLLIFYDSWKSLKDIEKMNKVVK